MSTGSREFRLMTYVECLIGTQSWCTHPYCVNNTPKCNVPNPSRPWQGCVQSKGHKGKHYLPPISFNYEYWSSDES